jgi:hypothetical protein
MPAIVKAYIERHIQHLLYPSTKSQLLAACNNMAEMPEFERKWIADTLPEGRYERPEDVIRALGL